LQLPGCQMHVITRSALVLSLKVLLGEDIRTYAGDGQLSGVSSCLCHHIYHRAGRRPCNGKAWEQTHFEMVCAFSRIKETPSPVSCSAV